MFSSIGWGEILIIVVLGVIIIGPERLPGVIEDVRAALFAARKAINNAKAELNGDLGEMSKELDALRGPISTAAEWGRMGPRAAITKALFDGNEDALNDFDPRRAQHQPGQYGLEPSPKPPAASFDYSKVYAPNPSVQPWQSPEGTGATAPGASASSAPAKPDPAQQPQAPSRRDSSTGQDGFSWPDVT